MSNRDWSVVSEDNSIAYNREQARIREEMQRLAQMGEPDPLADVPTEQIVELWREAEAHQSRENAVEYQLEAATQFTVNHPEYLKTPANAAKVTKWLEQNNSMAQIPSTMSTLFRNSIRGRLFP